MNLLFYAADAIAGLLVLLVLAAAILELQNRFRRVTLPPDAARVWLMDALFVAMKRLPNESTYSFAVQQALAMHMNRYLKLHNLRLRVQVEDVLLLIEALKARETLQALREEAGV